jgi:hypothetical protein
MMKKLTPVLVVDHIAPVLPLWDALGFKRTVEVPHGDSLGFVILQNGPVEVMYQTVESVRADEPRTLEGRSPVGGTALYIEVERLADVSSRLPKTTDVIVKERKTFYGATEMIIRDAAGNVILFAQPSST